MNEYSKSQTTPSQPRLIAEGPFFAQLWESVLFDPELTSNAKIIYAVLQRFAAWYGPDAVFPSQEEIARHANISRETVNSCLRQLHERGHIERERTGRGWRVILVRPVENSDTSGNGRVENSDRLCGKNPQIRVENSDTIKRDVRESRESTPLPPTGGAAARRKRIPSDWALSEHTRAYAIEHGIPASEVEGFAEEFKTYWQGDGRVKADWDLTFMNRVREKAATFVSKGGNGHHPEISVDELERIKAQARGYGFQGVLEDC